MNLSGIPLSELPKSVRETFLLMTKRPQILFRAYRMLSAVFVLGLASSFLYMWVFSVMSRAQPIWAFLLGLICAGLSALVMHMILTHDDSAFSQGSQEKHPWDAFAILVAIVTLPVYALAHVVRFRYLIRTKFPDPKQDVRYELLQTFFLDVLAWNRCVPAMSQFMRVRQFSSGKEVVSEHVSDQLTELKRHEGTLRDIARRLHGELSMHPMGTLKVVSTQAVLLEEDLRAWKKATEVLVPGLFLHHLQKRS
ncbi:MAG: hypothetical protein NTX72_04225 [Candidatus Uhrbacteria bacterium]|nr:hypothetical protein [Candidatus Uhrbacteria bacterium]